jgi:hypothetical protein
LFARGKLSSSSACSTENEPGRWAWRKLHEAREMLFHDRLRRDGHEGVLDEPSHVVAGHVLRPLERIGGFSSAVT